LKLNGAKQLWIYADCINILYGSVHIIKKHTEALVFASKETGLEVNADKPKYMVMSQDQNAGRRHSIKIDNSSFRRVEQFKYLGTSLTKQNSINEEIKSRLNHTMLATFGAESLFSRLLYTNFKIKMYRTIILSIVLYGCYTLLLTMREERRLRVFENRVLRRIYGPKRDEVTRGGQNNFMRSSLSCTAHQILFR
jgi:hypothetical protein